MVKPKGDLMLIRLKDINLPITYENIAWFTVCNKIGGDYGLELLEDEIDLWDEEEGGR